MRSESIHSLRQMTSYSDTSAIELIHLTRSLSHSKRRENEWCTLKMKSGSARSQKSCERSKRRNIPATSRAHLATAIGELISKIITFSSPSFQTSSRRSSRIRHRRMTTTISVQTLVAPIIFMLTRQIITILIVTMSLEAAIVLATPKTLYDTKRITCQQTAKFCAVSCTKLTTIQ